MEYRWRWAVWRWGWRWACTFHIFCVDFICIWCPTRTPFPVEYGLKVCLISYQDKQPTSRQSSTGCLRPSSLYIICIIESKKACVFSDFRGKFLENECFKSLTRSGSHSDSHMPYICSVQVPLTTKSSVTIGHPMRSSDATYGSHVLGSSPAITGSTK